MGTSFFGLFWKTKRKPAGKEQGCSLNKLKPTCKIYSGTFKLKKLTKKNLLGDFPLASSNVVYI